MGWIGPAVFRQPGTIQHPAVAIRTPLMEETVDKETFIKLVTERIMDLLADDRPAFQKNPSPTAGEDQLKGGENDG